MYVGTVLARAYSAVSTGTTGTEPSIWTVMSRNVMSKLRAVWGIISARGRALNSQWAAARCARRGANLPDGPRFSARPHGGGKGDARVTDVPILIPIPIFISLWGIINTVIYSVPILTVYAEHTRVLWVTVKCRIAAGVHRVTRPSSLPLYFA